MPHFHDASDELRDLTTQEKQVVGLTLLGSFFIGFDFIIYFFFNKAITDAFFPSDMPAFWRNMGFVVLLMIGYLSRPLGGVILADWGDRRGRKLVMLMSLLIVSIATLAIGLLPTFQQIGGWAVILLLLARFFQGIGIGSEVTASWVYLAEHMPRRHVGSACGLLIASFISSALSCHILSSLLASLLTPSQFEAFGWRLPFLLGAIGTLVAIVLRYRLIETPIWQQAHDQNKLIKHFPLQVAFRGYRYGLLMTFGLSWFSSSVYLIVFLMMPTIATQYFELDENFIAIANGVALFFGAFGAFIFGYCADRFNSGRVFSVGCMLLAVTGILFFLAMKDSSELILLAYAMFGFFAGIIGLIPSVCVRLFPVQVRLSGTTFSYNIAYALTGGLTPWLLNYFADLLALSPVLYLTFLCVVGIIMGFFLTNLHGLYRLEARPPVSPPDSLERLVKI